MIISLTIDGKEYHGSSSQVEEQLQSVVDNLRQQVRACLNFMECEMGWEDFREEMLSHDDEPKQNCHRENIRLLKNFLVAARAAPFAGGRDA